MLSETVQHYIVLKWGASHIDWRGGVCIVSLYKRICDKYECSNSIGISLSSVFGKRVTDSTAIGEEKCGFGQTQGRLCM